MKRKSISDYNLRCAMKVCSGSDDVRKDHYDGKNALYKVSAFKIIDPKLPLIEYMNQVTELFNKLRKLEIPPTRIDIDGRRISVDWPAYDCQVLSSRGQYAGLIVEFAIFLEELDLDLKIETGSFSDDPEYVTDLSKANFFPSFNKECFGSRVPIEVIKNRFTSFDQDDYYNYLAMIENYYID